MDHGMMGEFRSLEDIFSVVSKVTEGGADAILVTPAIAKHLVSHGKIKIPFVLSIPFDKSYVKYSVKLDADAVKTTYFGQVPLDWSTINNISEISLACEEWGMPYMVEIVPTDQEGTVLYDLEKVKQAARIGAELGGDICKTAYVGPPSEYRKVVTSTLIPITVMGGAKMGSVKDVLTMLKEAMESGACGGTIGRNIWQHPNPEKVVKALVAIIHEDKEVDEALKKVTG